MIFERLRLGYSIDDEDFDKIYSRTMRKVSDIHFTPVEVARAAAEFLVRVPGTQVLDVGSGAGKFCMIGASCTNGLFTGIEQRKYLCLYANFLSKYHRLSNTTFIHSNITEIDFKQFNAVYFYNAFYENIFQDSAIDASVPLDKSLYLKYSQYMCEQLDQMPMGTRLATYFSYADEVPASYEIQTAIFDRKLKLWEKIS